MRFSKGKKLDGLLKGRKYPFYVIPAKAGIQYFRALADIWIPAFAGMTTFYEIVKLRMFLSQFLIFSSSNLLSSISSSYPLSST